MCNYLNNYNNLNGCSLHLVCIFLKNVQKNVFLNCLVNFQNCPVIKKKGHYGFKVYPYPNILIHLVNWTTYMLPY